MGRINYSTICIIYNPKSTGPSKRSALALKRKLSRLYRDIDIRLLATEHSGHAEQLAYDCTKNEKKPLIISCSGDGGYNEVINGAMQAQEEGGDPVCAVLPAGNANDHSRTLHKKPLFKLIKEGRLEKIDLLQISLLTKKGKVKRYAHSYVGVGLTPAVAVELNKTNLNMFKELLIAGKAFLTFSPIRIKVGKREFAVDSMLFTNIGEMAKLLTVAKNAKPDDGKFEVVIFEHRGKKELARKLVKASTTGLDTSLQTDKFSFLVEKNTPIQLDGEVHTASKMTKVRIECRQKMLKTIL